MIFLIIIVDFFVAQHFIHTALNPLVLVGLNLLIYYLCLPWIKKGITKE